MYKSTIPYVTRKLPSKRVYEVVRRGDIYCAPWCGLGCTYAQFLEVKARAESLRRRLGEGWRIRLWDNLGWHGKVINGEFEISVRSAGDRFTARLIQLNPKLECGGCGNFSQSANLQHKSDIVNALQLLVNEASVRRDNLDATIRKAEKIIAKLERK